MTPVDQFLLIVGMALVTFAVRYPVLAIIGRLTLPPLMLRGLRYVPVAVLTAIIAPTMVFREDEVFIALDNAYLVAGIVTIIIAWRTRNLLATIVLGMMVFFLWRALTGI